MALGELHAAAVGLVMVGLGGFDGAREVQELGAVKADALAAGAEDGLELVGKLDVADDVDRSAVGRHAREVGDVGEGELEEAPLLDLVAVLVERGGVGVENDGAAVSVQDHGHPVARGRQQRLAADDGGDLQGLGDDGGVAGAAAEIGREAEDAAAVEAGGLRGREVAGDDDGVGRRGGEAVLALTDELGHNAVGEVFDVVDFGREHRVVHATELVGEREEGLAGGVFGAHAFGLDAGADGLDEGGVFEHRDVEEEDLGGLDAHFLLGLVVDEVEFVDGAFDGGVEAGELLFEGVGRHDPTGDAAEVVVDDEDAADDDPGGDGKSLEDVHSRGGAFADRFRLDFGWFTLLSHVGSVLGRMGVGHGPRFRVEIALLGSSPISTGAILPWRGGLTRAAYSALIHLSGSPPQRPPPAADPPRGPSPQDRGW